MKTFLKKTELNLVNGGYLTSKDGAPVNNDAFVNAQKHAEYIVKFAELAKGRDFKGKKADCIETLRKDVQEALSKKSIEFVAAPKKVGRKLTDQLKEEALAFMSFESETTKVEKMNAFLQQFEVLNDFEEFGLFFDEGIVKLNKIYTMKEIIAAVKETIDLLQ